VRPARRRSSLLIITNVITGVQHLWSPNKSVWLNGSAVMDFSVSALRKLAGTACFFGTLQIVTKRINH